MAAVLHAQIYTPRLVLRQQDCDLLSPGLANPGLVGKRTTQYHPVPLQEHTCAGWAQPYAVGYVASRLYTVEQTQSLISRAWLWPAGQRLVQGTGSASHQSAQLMTECTLGAVP